MIAVILAIIGLIFLIVGFITHLWIIFLLAAIFFIICAITIYVKSKRKRPAFSESGEEIRIESSVNYSRQTTVDTGSTQKLNRLTELRNAGILTDEEYEQKRSEIERETAPVEKAVPEAAPAEKAVPDTAPAEKAVPEAAPAEKAVPETAPAEKTVSEAAPAEKTVTEAAPAEKTVPDADTDKKLKKLAELRDEGILTDEEYEQKKNQIVQETAPAKKTEPDAATVEKINKLAELRDEGILTDEEYEQKKAKLLEDSA